MNLGQHILICLVQVYRWTLSPTKTFLFGPLGGCRFTPSCSQYALDSIRIHGAISGSGLSLKRICRCHPFGGCGDDPVPGSIRVPHVESGVTPDSHSSNNYFKQLEERGSRRDALNRPPEAHTSRFKIQDSKFKTALHGS